MASLQSSLEKQRKTGDIDFIQVPLDWGRCHKEFIIYSHKYNTFSRIFFDNKYRQDTFTPNIKNIQSDLDELSKGLNDIGVYNTREEYEQKKKELDFYLKNTK